MSTFQVTALITIALAGAIYVWRGVRRALRAEARFRGSRSRHFDL